MAANGNTTHIVSKTVIKVANCEIDPRRWAGLSNAITRPSNSERLAMARAEMNAG
jgi:hypothetical protein